MSNQKSDHTDTMLETPTTSRREFLQRSSSVLVGVALASALQPQVQAQSRTQPNAASKGVVDLGPVTTFKASSVTDRTKDFNAYISNTSSGLIALVAICTHEGCKPNLATDTQAFFCPCHRAEFASDGATTRGPARTPLARFALSVKNGRLMMDTRNFILRSSVQDSDFLKLKP